MKPNVEIIISYQDPSQYFMEPNLPEISLVSFFELATLTKIDSELNDVYRGGKNIQLKLQRVRNLQPAESIEFPVRTRDCRNFECVYNFKLGSEATTFKCDHIGQPVGLDHVYLDTRLANLLTRLKKKKTDEIKNLKYYRDILIILDDQNNLFARMPDGSGDVNEADYQKNQSVNVTENFEESKRETIATVEKEATKYVESLDLTNQITKDIGGLIDKTLARLDIPKIAADIADRAHQRRECGKQHGLFAISYGNLVTNVNSKSKKLRTIKLISPSKYRYEDLVGAGWFYHFEPNQKEEGKRHLIFSVAGAYKPEGSGNTPELIFKGDLVAFGILPEGKGNTALCQELFTNREQLKLVCPAVTYCRPVPNKKYDYDGKAYIIGGIDKNMRATDNIFQFNISSNKLELVGKIMKKRFNHACTNYKGKIYIVGGINMTTYLGSQGGDRIQPYQRISDLAYLQNIAEGDIEVFEPGKGIKKLEPPYDYMKTKQLMVKQIAMVIPMATKTTSRDYIVLFGGHPGIQLDGRQPIAYDILKNQWVEFGQNMLNTAFCLGQDQAISLHNNIIDFEGEQYQNSTVFLYSNFKEAQPLVYTSKGADAGYMWMV